MTAVFASKFASDPKLRLLKTLVDISVFYQDLEMNQNCDKTAVRCARTCLFSNFGRLFAISEMVVLFSQNVVFVNSIAAFLFEEPVRPVVLPFISNCLPNLGLPSALPPILLQVMHIACDGLPSGRSIALLTDLLECLNTGRNHPSHLDALGKLSELCSLLCRSMAKLSSDACSRRLFSLALSFLALMSPHFDISADDVSGLISGCANVNESSYWESLIPDFTSLLAQSLRSAKFAMFQPKAAASTQAVHRGGLRFPDVPQSARIHCVILQLLL
jgi:hypothetical protein